MKEKFFSIIAVSLVLLFVGYFCYLLINGETLKSLGNSIAEAIIRGG